tara:strand:+ start:296 stop:586 length:291 start_codon:yes stop_codon:yes gene_type:complete
MKSSIKKWGKEITYSVENNEAWIAVTEGPWIWVHIMNSQKNGKIEDKDLTKIIKDGNRPEFVNRRGMNDLLQHFGVDSEVRNKLFQKETDSVKVNV